MTDSYVLSPGAVGLLGMVGDLDRCIHGQHSTDPCLDCPDAQSAGNDFAPPGKRIGTTARGEGIYVPASADRFMPEAWTKPPDDPSAADNDALNAAYRERAHLVAFLATQYPSVLVPAPDYPGWFIVYVNGPTGQMSWHLAPEDIDLFPDTVERAATWEWDRHDTTEKYRRLDTLTSAESVKEALKP